MLKEIEAQEEREKYIMAWNDTMLHIWQERITLLEVIDTGRLLASPVALPVRADGRFVEVTLSQEFLEYGLWQDFGVGRETPRGNSGDIGHAKVRQRRPCYDACQAAVARDCDILIVDTAGRLHNKDYLMEELKKIVRVMKKVNPEFPQDIWLVIDGNTGQNTINQTKIFNQSFPLTGLVVTKLDGTARGGSVLSITSSLQIPIRWVGMGEQIDQLVEFNKREYIDGLFENALEESK